MPWRDAHTLHIFVPQHSLYQFNWVEQILGSIVRPLYERFNSQIRWMWVTRYSGPYDSNNPPQGYTLPDNYLVVGRDYRFIAFRLSVEDSVKLEIHRLGLDLAQEAGCYAPEWVHYDTIGDLGSNRFIFPEADETSHAERAHLILNFMDSIITLMLNALTKTESGSWILEPNISDQNPNQSLFESIHHLFCNATGVPTEIFLSRQSDNIQIATHWMNFRNFQVSENEIHRLPINY